MSLAAIFFDLDGTLRHNEPEGFRMYVEYLAELGHSLTPEQRAHGERWTHYYWSVAPELQDDIEAYSPDTPEFWAKYSERQIAALNLDDPANTIAQQVNQLFTERYKPINRVPEDVLPTLARLRQAGYTLGLVSNRLGSLDTVAKDLGLSDYFHFTLSAGQAGAWKPSPKIFERALELAQCSAYRAMYVGDNFYADVEGARAAGLQPVLIDPRGLFPEAGCLVIHTIGDLLTLIPLNGEVAP